MTENSLRIIAIDPGLEKTGIAVLDIKGKGFSPLFCDCIITKRNESIQARLENIYHDIDRTIKRFKPDCMVVEQLFFSINVKTALSVGHARGISILTASINELEVYEYTPLQVKQAITGYGRATKNQIKYMLKVILGVKDDFFPSQDDAWDAMAIAVCHANSRKLNSKLLKGLDL